MITELDPGGAERALTQLVLYLDKSEWEPHVICLGPHGHFAAVLESANIPVICLNARGVFSVPRVLVRLWRELSRLRPAIVQTFLFHANLLGRIAARLAGVKIVVSGLRVAEHRSPWYGRLDRWTTRLVTTNVCVSQGVADFSKNVVGLNAARLVVIPNGVDFERFANAKPADLRQFGFPAGSRVFIAIGRLEYQKGFDVLIESIALLKPFPDNLFFLVVGDGPDLDKLQLLAGKHRITDHIHFAGRREDIPSLLAACSALILSSRWEGMPNVVLEAMAAGRPVIATQVEGIPELVRDGVTGLTVPPENPAALATAIQSLLSRHEFLSAAGPTSQAIAKKEFAITETTNSYAKLYCQLLAERGSRSAS